MSEQKNPSQFDLVPVAPKFISIGNSRLAASLAIVLIAAGLVVGFLLPSVLPFETRQQANFTYAEIRDRITVDEGLINNNQKLIGDNLLQINEGVKSIRDKQDSDHDEITKLAAELLKEDRDSKLSNQANYDSLNDRIEKAKAKVQD